MIHRQLRPGARWLRAPGLATAQIPKRAVEARYAAFFGPAHQPSVAVSAAPPPGWSSDLATPKAPEPAPAASRTSTPPASSFAAPREPGHLLDRASLAAPPPERSSDPMISCLATFKALRLATPVIRLRMPTTCCNTTRFERSHPLSIAVAAAALPEWNGSPATLETLEPAPAASRTSTPPASSFAAPREPDRQLTTASATLEALGLATPASRARARVPSAGSNAAYLTPGPRVDGPGRLEAPR